MRAVKVFIQDEGLRRMALARLRDMPLPERGVVMSLTMARSRRSLEQNAKLWAMLTDISRQVEWYGRHLTSTDWKHVFTAALSKQDVVPGIDGGFVVLGKSTSAMSSREMSDLIELMTAFGAERSVRFSAPEDGHVWREG